MTVRPGWRGRRLSFGVGLTLGALAVTGVGLGIAHAAAGRPAPASSLTASSQQASAASASPANGDSVIAGAPSTAGVALRPCPRQPAQGATDCAAEDWLPNGTRVVMRCWVSGLAPADGSSAKWFYVNEVDGSHPGWSGYVWSDYVAAQTQIAVPGCTPAILKAYQDPVWRRPPPAHFAVVGTCTTAGGVLTGVSSGFTPGAQYEISATYPDGSPYPLRYTTGTVNADGSVAWRWPCAGDPPGTYNTQLVDLGDGNTADASFTIGAAPQPGTGQTATPAPTGQPPGPVTSPQPTQPPSTLYQEQEGHHGANTFTSPHNASGVGTKITPGQYVQVSCKLYDPAITSVNPDGYWYRIASSPWNNQYYAAANTFMNGDPWNGPFTHNTDYNVPDC